MARERVQQALERPFDPQEAARFDRERWGSGNEALAAAAAKDALFGDATYEK